MEEEKPSTKYNIFAYFGIGVFLLIGIIVAIGYIKGDGTDIGSSTNTTIIIDDKEKIYDSLTKTVTINDESTKEEIVNIKLDTPQINYVSLGYQKVAEFTCSDSKYCLPTLIEFYNLKDNNKSIAMSPEYRYLSRLTKNVTDWEVKYNKEADKDGAHYYPTITGYHMEDEYLPYIPQNLSISKETLTIGMFVTVHPGDSIEWVPTFKVQTTDIKVSEWATFNAVGYIYQSTVEAYASYPDTGLVEFTDGNYAPNVYNDAKWIGYHTTTPGSIMNITIDMGATVNLTNASLNVFSYTAGGMYLPTTTIWGSTDNSSFTNLGTITLDGGDAAAQTVRNGNITAGLINKNYRYVRYRFVQGSGEWIWVGEGSINWTDNAMGSQYCNFTGYLFNSSGGGMLGGVVVVLNQTSNLVYANTTTNSAGYWTINVSNNNYSMVPTNHLYDFVFRNSTGSKTSKSYHDVNSTCP